MKKQTIVIVAAAIFFVAVGVSIFLHFKKKRAADTSPVYAFLNQFNDSMKKKNISDVMFFFDDEAIKNNTYRPLMIKLMALDNYDSGDGNVEPYVSLNLNSADIKVLNSGLTQVVVPAILSFEKLEKRTSQLTLKLIKQGNTYKITQIVADRFMLDYVTYENFIMDKTMRDEDRFSPETLAAFKASAQLKGKYDSVIWFAHVNDKTYYYVVKGDWTEQNGDSVEMKYKMGLVGPDMNEIIPPEFGLIHNINGMFNNLVEVEKQHKKGFYDLTGKNVLPVIYDRIYPVNDAESIAVLQKGDDFFWLKNDYTLSDKVDLKIADILVKLKNIGPYNLTGAGLGDKNITEFNSRDQPGSIYIPPSYLIDLDIMRTRVMEFKNPLRKRVAYEEISDKYLVQAAVVAEDKNNNWLQATFYKIRDYFLGGRSEFYESKKLLVVDNRSNKLYTANVYLSHTNEDGDDGLGRGAPCDVNVIRAINDSLFEVKSGSSLSAAMYDTTRAVEGGVYYDYMALRNGKLVTLPNRRQFSFTKYVKMNDGYLNTCYNISEGHNYKDRKFHTVSTVNAEMLSYMKNEIYADYSYQFKDKRWMNVFEEFYSRDDNEKPKTNANVDDSLTVIDKYNINFIQQKLSALKPSDKVKVNLK